MQYLLEAIEMDTSPAEVRAWMQKKKGDSNYVTFPEFLDGCQKWFGSNVENIKVRKKPPILKSYEIMQRNNAQALAFDHSQDAVTSNVRIYIEYC